MRLLRTVGQVVRRRPPQLQLLPSPSRVASLVTFAVVALTALLAVAIPDVRSAIDWRRQATTVRRMRDAAVRIEQGHRSLHVVDGWGHPMQIRIRNGDDYMIRAARKDGRFESGPPRREVRTLEEDVVLDSGVFVQWGNDGL